MSAAPTRERISALRQEIEALETGSMHGFSAARRHLQSQAGFAAADRFVLGHAQADGMLGGLAVAAIHDVVPTGAPDMAAATCALPISGWLDSTAILATRFRSSRTFPGHPCESSSLTASGAKKRSALFKRRKCSASATISSGRSRSGGTCS